MTVNTSEKKSVAMFINKPFVLENRFEKFKSSIEGDERFSFEVFLDTAFIS